MKLTKPYKKIEGFTKIHMLMINLLLGSFGECSGDYSKCPGTYDNCPGTFRSC